MHIVPYEARDEDLFAHMAATAQPALEMGDPLDDVFGSDAESSGLPAREGMNHGESHPSDARRLQSEHATAGYREGITAAKAHSIQAGFDEGFSLGATIGQKAGQLLGLLEGIANALRPSQTPASSRAQQLLEDGRKDLSLESVFGEEYWAPDGTWKFVVGGASCQTEENGDIVFEDVAKWHPLVRKWADLVDRELDRWKISKQVLDLPSETPRDSGPDKINMKSDQPNREVLDW